ncbi:tyrosine-type recombinase/integrase [Burkholderia ambifaria]|uniref:tyrosine-type recombinase/integrase n=1 Tax=Burkholderia ambifaria TaxID=152480 RepID=UPI0015899989|nr:integrase family protein [Burkholderia ambifaria]
MAHRENFTVERVAGYACPAGKQQAFFWDSKAIGFGLRVTAAGARAYVFEGRLHGKTIRLTIGGPSAWKIPDARDRATELRRMLDQGIDPRERAAEERAAHEARKAEELRQDVTVRQAWDAYVNHLRTSVSPKTKQPRSERYIDEHVMYASPGGAEKKRGKGKTKPGLLFPMMGLKLSELTAAQLRQRIEAETAGRPTAAAYAYRMVRAFAGWCSDQDEYSRLIPSDAVSSTKVTGVVPVAKAKDGDCLQREQLVAWFSETRKYPDPVMGAYLQALLLTGARREELAALRWSDVDFRWCSMRIADKIEGERVIPLTPYISSVLTALKRVNDAPPNVRQLRTLNSRGEEWRPSDYVFASKTSESGRITSPKGAHKRVLDQAGLPHVTLHGLRRSFGTLSEWCEVPVGVVAQIQGHKPSAVAEKHYRRRPLDMLRLWHERIESWMLEQAGIDFKPDQSASKLVAVNAA